MLYYKKIIVVVLIVLINSFIGVCQTSKTIPSNWSQIESSAANTEMFVWVKIPQSTLPLIQITGDSTNGNIAKSLESYSSSLVELKKHFIQNEFEKIVVTRENYFSLSSYQQIQFKEFIEARTKYFEAQFKVGLLGQKHFVLNEQDFDEVIKIISQK